ncbi:hypothetical protein THAR02_03356 [Trichoderma harzianum]|uniref:Uncharacterized protein n=1 Tax=Trichoderma harzianum TaxID=5544 RepID=A0A0F9XJE9_TRIHA|nr:hypothetical protein THAR02_03356 [Trichoderma harzianum]
MALPSSAPLYVDVFGKSGEIGDLVQNFDFSKINPTGSNSNEFLHIDLAPSFGKLNKESLRELDDHLKIMIAGNLKALGNQPDKSWNAVLSNMMQNPLLDPSDGGPGAFRADKFKGSVNGFEFDGSPDANIVREVQAWFNNLISDDDVLNSTKIDVEVLAKIVAQIGVILKNFETFFAKDEYHEQALIDINVLRFPDVDQPYFKAYHIKLAAWSDPSRSHLHQEDTNGITGEFNSRIFRPRTYVIQKLNSATFRKAAATADALFDD